MILFSVHLREKEEISLAHFVFIRVFCYDYFYFFNQKLSKLPLKFIVNIPNARAEF